MSPFSVASGLHVLLIGADGGTREQLEEMLASNSETHLELQKINHVRDKYVNFILETQDASAR